jgi:ABC-type transporter Mla subunit MlaD
MTTNNNKGDRIDRIEELIIKLANTQERLAETMGSSHEFMSEIRTTMAENISLLTQAVIDLRKQQDETDRRFNVLLEEFRYLNRRIQNRYW